MMDRIRINRSSTEGEEHYGKIIEGLEEEAEFLRNEVSTYAGTVEGLDYKIIELKHTIESKQAKIAYLQKLVDTYEDDIVF